MSEVLYTPDRRYAVFNGVLWRATNPALSEAEAAALRKQLGKARGDVARANKAGDAAALKDARRRVNEAKTALGERGPVWWTDGAPDYNRHKATNTPYADWWQSLTESAGRPRE